MLETILYKYKLLILTKPLTPAWIVLREILHWATIPLKLVLIASIGVFQILRNGPAQDIQGEDFNPDKLNVEISELEQNLPVFKNEWYELYVNRVSLHAEINGTNHNTDHQSQRQGIYQFIQTLEGKSNEQIDYATSMHVNSGGILARGYHVQGPDPKAGSYNTYTTSGDMLAGLSLAALTSQHLEFPERFVKMVEGVIKNDYAVIEPTEPEDAQLKLMYQTLKGSIKQMKSDRGNWQPGLETVGAQALTVLAAIKVAYHLSGSKFFLNEYNKLFYKHGYGLLSLFPTTYIDSRRGYYNEHNTMLNLYVLNKLSKTLPEKIVYRFAMKYTWSLSKNWYNAWFTFLLEDAVPGSVSKKYKSNLSKYLLKSVQNSNEMTIGYKKSHYSSLQKLVTLDNINQGEFLPEMPHEVATEKDGAYRSGLGWYVNLVSLKHLMKERK